MTVIYLPRSTAAHYIASTGLPMGKVQLSAVPGTAPERTVPVVLALYYAGAYPAHYYRAGKLQTDVCVRTAERIIELTKDEIN
jgi:hypothetical protein